MRQSVNFSIAARESKTALSTVPNASAAEGRTVLEVGGQDMLLKVSIAE